MHSGCAESTGCSHHVTLVQPQPPRTGSWRDFAKPRGWAGVPAGCWGPPVSWGQRVPLSKVPGMRIWRSPGVLRTLMPACQGLCACPPQQKLVLTLGQRSDGSSWQVKGIYSTAQSSRALFLLGVSGCLSPISSRAPLRPAHFDVPTSPADAPRGAAGRHAELSEGEAAQAAFVPDTTAMLCVSRSLRLSLLAMAVQMIGFASPLRNCTQY